MSEVEEAAYSRRFYVMWFGLFTLISMALNGAHAYLFAPRAWNELHTDIRTWLAVTGGMPTWFALTGVGIALIPPIGLAAATHALVTPDPNTTSGRGTGARTTTWLIALAALTLSTVMITDLVRMVLGVDWRLALLIPLVVDVSIMAAVLRLEIRREGHRAEAHLPDESPQVGGASPTHDVSLERIVEHVTAQSVVPHEASVERTVAQPTARRGASVTRPKAQPARFTLSDSPASVASRIVDQTPITQTVETITEVIESALAGGSNRGIAESVRSVSASTVGRILAAARELDQDSEPNAAEITEREPTLTAVG